MIYQSISKDPIVKHMVKCRYCKKHISEKACRFLFWPAADRLSVLLTSLHRPSDV